MNKRVITGLFIGSFVIMVVMLRIGYGIVADFKAEATRDYYAIEEDQVPSIKLVVGQRKIKSIYTSREDGIQKKEYEYQSDTAKKDVEEYITYLQNNAGFLVVSSETDGEVLYGRESKSEGQVVLVSLYSSPSGYTVIVKKERVR